MENYIVIGITDEGQIVTKKYSIIDENNTTQFHLKTAIICNEKNDRHLKFWHLTTTYRKSGETGINEDALKSIYKFPYNHGDGVFNVLRRALATLKTMQNN